MAKHENHFAMSLDSSAGAPCSSRVRWDPPQVKPSCPAVCAHQTRLPSGPKRLRGRGDGPCLQMMDTLWLKGQENGLFPISTKHMEQKCQGQVGQLGKLLQLAWSVVNICLPLPFRTALGKHTLHRQRELQPPGCVALFSCKQQASAVRGTSGQWMQ